VTIDALPKLRFSSPLCPVCLEETSRQEGTYQCADCGIEWDGSGENPTFVEPELGQCRSTLTRERGGLNLETERFRCMRNRGHDAPGHASANLLSGWKTGEPGVSEVAP
jgi:ribosomal protein L37AE/L43A